MVAMKLDGQMPKFRIFGRAEMKELPKLLAEDEEVVGAVYGFYQGGSGVLVVTDKRVILIDKQPLYVNLEALAYAYITKVEFSVHTMQGTLKVCAGSHGLHFRSLSDARLKQLFYYIRARAEVENSHFAKLIEQSQSATARSTVLIPRRRATKFYPLHRAVRLIQE